MTRSGIIAGAIRSATYSELMDIADHFAQMQQDLERDLKSAEGWAEILDSWAEANEENGDE